jgi:two-component system response regulator YesN
MNKVMIVDDEKLVRQGIITTFPWKKYGFEVACDAPSGEKALELLKREPIDLLVTDLAMNGMSGLDLIKEARKLREDLPVVVLTCHDNFKYIQEAMRLGVLDYIVKTEIEDEVVDETLTRIAGKLKERKRGIRGDESRLPNAETLSDGVMFCGPSRSSTSIEFLGGEDREGWAARMAEIDTAAWFLRLAPSEAELFMERAASRHAPERWVCVRFRDIPPSDEQTVIAKLRRWRRKVLFYSPSPSLQEWDWAALPEPPEAIDDTLARLRNGWNASDWVYDKARFDELLRMTREAACDAGELRNMFYPVALEWERLLNDGSLNLLLDHTDDWLFWRDVEDWLHMFRNAIWRTVERNAAQQLADAVFRAVHLIRNRGDFGISEEELAHAVNMSRGHFSKSFKKVTGKSYGEYIRQLKLERAKEMLVRTDEPITRIAEKCGFQDYRYFSRAFREYTGRLPTEFRKAGAGHPPRRSTGAEV